MEIFDVKGLGCKDIQKLKVEVCTCQEGSSCSPRFSKQRQSSATIGFQAILVVISALILLMLIPLLLLICLCGQGVIKFADMPFETKEHLIAYNTEGQGEDRDVPPFTYADSGRMMSMVKGVKAGGDFGGAAFESSMATGAGYMASMSGGGQSWGGGVMEMMSMDQRMASGFGMMQQYDSGIALPNEYLNWYYLEKSQGMEASANDTLLMCNHEGNGSATESIGCCSLLESENDLEFLNNLGPKFTTLAEICSSTKLMMAAPTPVPPPAPPPAPSPAPKLAAYSESMSIQANTSNMVNQVAQAVSSSSSSTCTEENVMVQNNHTQTVVDVLPTQTLMLQQQQPLYYMLEPQVTNPVLLAERPAVGLTQGMYVLNSSPMAETVLVQGGQNSVVGGDQVMLLETHGGTSQPLNMGLLQSAQMSSSQLLLVDGNAQSGQKMLQKGSMAKSQSGLLMEGQGGVAKHGRAKTFVVGPNFDHSETFDVNQNLANSGVINVSSTVVKEDKDKQLKRPLPQGTGIIMLGDHVANTHLASSRAFLSSPSLAKTDTYFVSQNLGNSEAFVTNQNHANSGIFTMSSRIVKEKKDKQ